MSRRLLHMEYEISGMVEFALLLILIHQMTHHYKYEMIAMI